MVNYLYRCAERHETTASAPMGEASARIDCACGLPASRVPAAPMLSTAGAAHRRAVDAAAATAERPAVVDHVPQMREAARQPSDPRHAQLPRP